MVFLCHLPYLLCFWLEDDVIRMLELFEDARIVLISETQALKELITIKLLDFVLIMNYLM
jgi:hypothetical protein